MAAHTTPNVLGRCSRCSMHREWPGWRDECKVSPAISHEGDTPAQTATKQRELMRARRAEAKAMGVSLAEMARLKRVAKLNAGE
jgi:hypothetical protein